nr:MAG TPA: hypothetical protein [Caudoviricetes sp.]
MKNNLYVLHIHHSPLGKETIYFSWEYNLHYIIV